MGGKELKFIRYADHFSLFHRKQQNLYISKPIYIENDKTYALSCLLVAFVVTQVCAITPFFSDSMHPEPHSFVLGCVNLLIILVSVRHFVKFAA
jgi:hypothetical protein